MLDRPVAVTAIFTRRQAAERVVLQLLAAGYHSERVSVLMQDDSGTTDAVIEKQTKLADNSPALALSTGAFATSLGALPGICLLAIPGLGPMVAAGPLITALTDAGSGGDRAVVIAGLTGMGIAEDLASHYESHLKNGEVLLGVHCDSALWTNRAKDMLDTSGGECSAVSAIPPARGPDCV